MFEITLKENGIDTMKMKYKVLVQMHVTFTTLSIFFLFLGHAKEHFTLLQMQRFYSLFSIEYILLLF